MGAEQSRLLGQALLDLGNACRHGAQPVQEVLTFVETVWQQIDCNFKETLLKRLGLVVVSDRFDISGAVMINSIVERNHGLWTVRPETFFGDELSKPSLQEAARCLDTQKGLAELQQRFLHMAMAYVRGTHGYKTVGPDKPRVYEGRRSAMLASKFTLGAPFVIHIARSTLRKLPVDESNESHQKVMCQLEDQNALGVAQPYHGMGLAVWNYLVNHKLVRAAVNHDKEQELLERRDVWAKMSLQDPPPSQLAMSLQPLDQVAPLALPDGYASFATPQPTSRDTCSAQLFLPTASPLAGEGLSLSTTAPMFSCPSISLESHALESSASLGAFEYLS